MIGSAEVVPRFNSCMMGEAEFIYLADLWILLCARHRGSLRISVNDETM